MHAFFQPVFRAADWRLSRSLMDSMSQHAFHSWLTHGAVHSPEPPLVQKAKNRSCSVQTVGACQTSEVI